MLVQDVTYFSHTPEYNAIHKLVFEWTTVDVNFRVCQQKICTNVRYFFTTTRGYG